MKVTEKKIDNLNRELTIEVAAADYVESENKKLAELRRKADFKGFRKGMVPASMIKRVYGEQVLVEAVNQVIGKALDEHITGNKLRILGEPLPSEKQPQNEWADGNDFTFVFDLGLSPEVSVEVEKGDTVPSYTVTVTAKDKAPMIENLKKYYEENKEENKEPKTDEEIEKEVTERLHAQYKSEADWRLTKDIRAFYINKAGIEALAGGGERRQTERRGRREGLPGLRRRLQVAAGARLPDAEMGVEGGGGGPAHAGRGLRPLPVCDVRHRQRAR